MTMGPRLPDANRIAAIVFERSLVMMPWIDGVAAGRDTSTAINPCPESAAVLRSIPPVLPGARRVVRRQ